MALVLKSIYEVLTSVEAPKDGAAYENLPLTHSVLPILLINLSYVAIVFKIGPKFMKNRQAFDLTYVLVVYNLVQIVINLYLSLPIIYEMLTNDEFDAGCILKFPTDHYIKSTEVRHFYIYYLTKYLDYFETICFVLRKSYKQISFLHVYHHMIMSSGLYVYLRYHGFGGHTLMIGVVNSLVHAVMYTYYLVSALRTTGSAESSLWWKKYITKLQITQFVFLLVHQAWPLLVRTSCPYPKVWLFVTCSQAIMMICLFGNFYRKAYLRPKKARGAKNAEKIN